MDRPIGPKRFQTRAGISRKTKEEREQYAQEEADRQRQRLAETEQPAATSTSQRGRGSGRGRGASVIQERRLRPEVSGGVFGAAVPAKSKPKGRQASTISEASEEVSQSAKPQVTNSGPARTAAEESDVKIPAEETNVKNEKKTATRKTTASKKDEPVYLSSDEDVDAEKRRDIDRIYISSEDDEPVSSTAKGKQRELHAPRYHTSLRPVRAPRDDPAVADTSLSARNRTFAGVKNKDRPIGDDGLDVLGRDDDEMEISDHPFPDALSSPELERRAGKRKGGKAKDHTVIVETAEERAERLRSEVEVRKILEEFTSAPGRTNALKTSEDSDTMNLDTSADFPEDRRLYLFQFPPLTPFLVDPAEKIEFKHEGESDATLIQIPPTSTSTNTSAPPIIKKEADIEEAAKKPDVLTADNMHTPSGMVGMLRVHKSGKVTMDWGGTDMEIRYGTEVDFLQDAVLVDEGKNQAWALGQVKKKMVVIPDWKRLYE